MRAVAVFAVSAAVLAVWLAMRRSRHLSGAFVVLGLVIVEMAIGKVQYRTRLPWGLVLVHVVLAAVVWAASIAFVARLWRPWRAA